MVVIGNLLFVMRDGSPSPISRLSYLYSIIYKFWSNRTSNVFAIKMQPTSNGFAIDFGSKMPEKLSEP